jgi:hypothetical protein
MRWVSRSSKVSSSSCFLVSSKSETNLIFVPTLSRYHLPLVRPIHCLQRQDGRGEEGWCCSSRCLALSSQGYHLFHQA